MPRLSVERREKRERPKEKAWVMPLIIGLTVASLIFVVVMSITYDIF